MAVPAIAKAALVVAKSKRLRQFVGVVLVATLVGMIMFAALPAFLVALITPSASALTSVYCNAAGGAAPSTPQPVALTPEQTALVTQIRQAALAASTDPKAQLAALTAAFAATGLVPPTAPATTEDSPVGVYGLTARSGWGTGDSLSDAGKATTLILKGLPGKPGILGLPAWATLPSGRWVAAVGIDKTPDQISAAETTARTVLLQIDPTMKEGELLSGSACGFVPITGDVKALATALMPAIASGKLYGYSGVDQIKAIAAGTATAKCGIDVRILQIVTIAVNNFDKVGVSDINRYCTGSIEGAGTQSAHYLNGGGHAVDFMSLNGKAINGADADSLKLIGILDPIVPKGSRIGQKDVRTAHGVSIATQNFTQFDDTPDHLHVDVLWAKGGLQLPGLPPANG
jgi:hypothetical protein